MKKQCFIILALIIFLASGAIALSVSYSPPNIYYTLDKGVKKCGIVSFDITSDKTVNADVWADSPDVKWDHLRFNKTADFHDITIEYPKEITDGKRQFEVCMSGNKVGDFHGALIIDIWRGDTPEPIKIVVWLRLNITDPAVIPTPVAAPVVTNTSENTTSTTEANLTEEAPEPAPEETPEEETNSTTGSSFFSGAIIGSGLSSRAILITVIAIGSILLIIVGSVFGYKAGKKAGSRPIISAPYKPSAPRPNPVYSPAPSQSPAPSSNQNSPSSSQNTNNQNPTYRFNPNDL